MPSARTMVFSAALLVPQVSSLMIQHFSGTSSEDCTAANLKHTEYMGEECVLSMDNSLKFTKITCNSSKAVIKKYNDMNCSIPCTDWPCDEDGVIVNIDMCRTDFGMGRGKVTCGMGQAIKLERQIFSDCACTNVTASQPMYVNAGCTEISEWSNNAWTDKSRMVEVGTSTLKMDEYGTADCTGAKDNKARRQLSGSLYSLVRSTALRLPEEAGSKATCNMCMKGEIDGTGMGKVYSKMSSDTCVGSGGGDSACPATMTTTTGGGGGLPGGSASAGTRSSPLALVAIAVIAFLARGANA